MDNVNWVKAVAGVIALFGVMGLLAHPGFISFVMTFGGGYVFFTGDPKFTALRSKVQNHLNKD